MGVFFSVLDQSLPPKSKFNVEDIPDLTGKVTIVTGANTGVGKHTAKALLMHNAKVYIAARNQAKAEDAIADLRNATGKEALFLKLDLADLKAVKAAAEEFLRKEDQLHILFNNGGVMVPPIEQTTAQGIDLQFGTNVLGHFYFTKLLLPIMVATAKTSPDGKARVVNTSSSAHMFRNLDFATFKDGPARRKIAPEMLYSQSKHGNVVFATELARRYGDKGIVSTSLNPGNLKTDLTRHVGFFTSKLLDMVFYEGSYGALTQLWAGTSPEGAEFNGRFLKPWARIGVPRADSQDPQVGRELWAWLEEQVKDI